MFMLKIGHAPASGFYPLHGVDLPSPSRYGTTPQIQHVTVVQKPLLGGVSKAFACPIKWMTMDYTVVN
jgi:hypothetical protein